MNLFRKFYIAFFIILIVSAFSYVDSALTGLLLILAALISCRSIFSNHLLQGFSLTKQMLVYLFWLFVVALCSAIPNASMMNLAILAGLPVMYLVASNMENLSDSWKVLRIFFFILGVFLASWAVWQVAYHVGYGHAVGPLVDRNAFAALMNLLWFPATYLFLSNMFCSKRWLTVLLGCGFFVISTALFATASRGAILTWLVLQPFLLWSIYNNFKSKKYILITMSIVIIAYASSSMFLHSNVADRTFQIGPSTQTSQLSQDPSTNARLLMWQATLKIALDHPLVGTGWGTFVAYYPTYRSPLENTTSGVAAHNDYLQFAAEGGVIAMLLMFWILMSLLLQLKRSLKLSYQDSGFESTTLILGTLAIFLQAAVNFIFCFAFMNIVAGIYLARVAHLIDSPRTIKIPHFDEVGLFVKRLLAGFVLLLVTTPFVMHLISQVCLTGVQSGMKVINLFAPKVTPYNIASLITAIRPQEGIAQEYLLQTAEQVLFNNTINGSEVVNSKYDLLIETIKQFENARARSNNNPNMGVREVKMLIKFHAILGNNSAYDKAQQILNENLKIDPYHANSLIQMSRLQVAQGNRTAALQTLQYAESHIRTRRDQQLITVEELRQLAAPKLMPELDEIEDQLHMVRSDSETGKPLILPSNFSENIDERLSIIAENIQSMQ